MFDWVLNTFLLIYSAGEASIHQFSNCTECTNNENDKFG